MEDTRLSSLRLRDIDIHDSFWSRYIDLVAEVIIPYQWDILNVKVDGAQPSYCLQNVLNDKAGVEQPSYCLQNFRIAAGLEEGAFGGVVFQDTDVYKWLEAVAFSLESKPDPSLEELADGAIDLIASAQCSDGYLNTYYTLAEPQKRWSNLIEGHELYGAGHLIEAAVAYSSATGKDKLLGVASRYADLICDVFGSGAGQIRGYSGHQEIELALVKLYYATGEKKYLEKAKYFIDERGSEPNYFTEEIKNRKDGWLFDEFKNYDLKYSQAHIPPRKQRSAEGHAVRAVYMFCAMADLAREYGDAELLEACDALWDSVVNKRMYITGSIGSSGFLERFTTDYDLPNDSNYSESCASIGLALFGLRMAAIKRDARYIDVVERALYNTVLAGVGMDGSSYFYVNPLEVWPSSCMSHTAKAHVAPERQKWFSVACCPPNIARTLASLGQYVYFRDETELYVNLYIENKARTVFSENGVELDLKTTFLRDGRSTLTVMAENLCDFTLKLRVPDYAEAYAFTHNGKSAAPAIRNGYAVFEGPWEGKSVIEISFGVKPKFVMAHPEVRADAGKVALVKGPLVYCLEEADNGSNLAAVFVDADTPVRECRLDALPDCLTALCYKGYRLNAGGGAANSLYGDASFALQPVELTAVPYSVWGNRDVRGEMLVWQKVRLP